MGKEWGEGMFWSSAQMTEQNPAQRLRSVITVARECVAAAKRRGSWYGGPTRRLVAVIEAYHAEVEPDCTQCRTAPERSFSHRIQDRLLSGHTAIAYLALLWGCVATVMGRFENGGW